jgi:hypothetical protein
MPRAFFANRPRKSPTGSPGIHNWQYRCRKNEKLLETFSASGRVLCIFGSLDVRADVGHRETLVLLAGTGRAFSEILLALVEGVLLAAVDAHVLSRPDLLACRIRLLFGQIYHQISLLCQRYISVVLVRTGSFLPDVYSQSFHMRSYIAFFSPMLV